MKIPNNELHASHLRTYGAGGLLMRDQEAVHGCPARYKARYVTYDSRVMLAGGDNLSFGSVIHGVMELVDTEGLSTEEALKRVWSPELGPERFAEALHDLEGWLARTTPSSDWATVGVEMRLSAELYVDEEFGPISLGGRLDRLAIDLNEPLELKVIDYKTNRWPPSQEQVDNDVQLRWYDWLVRKNWAQLMGDGPPRVQVVLDAVKFGEKATRFSRQQMDEFEAWAEAIARRILRDQKGEPELGPGCHWCPLKLDCKEFKRLPGIGLGVMERRHVTDLGDLVAWADEAKEVRKQLTVGIDEVGEMLAEHVAREGLFEHDGRVWVEEPAFRTVLNVRQLHQVLGDRFWEFVSVSKTKIDQALRDDPSLRAEALKCWGRLEDGLKVKETKA